jgi:hypothetical protein
MNRQPVAIARGSVSGVTEPRATRLLRIMRTEELEDLAVYCQTYCGPSQPS